MTTLNFQIPLKPRKIGPRIDCRRTTAPASCGLAALPAPRATKTEMRDEDLTSAL